MNLMELDNEACIGCQMCVGICPTRALQFDQVAKKPLMSRPKQCMHCGHCFAVCPKGAIKLFGKAAKDEAFTDSAENVIGAIVRRRSIRRFLPQQLDRRFIKELINITKFCPSGMNFRPVKFIVIPRSFLDELTQKILPICESEFPGIQKLQARYDAIFRQAQHVIVAYTHKNALWGQQDAAIAIATIELFCQAKGVGSCWIGFLTRACQMTPKIQDMIGIEGDMTVQSCLGIGVQAFSFNRSVAREDVAVEWMD